MHQKTTRLTGLTVDLTAHEGEEGRLLLATLIAEEAPPEPSTPRPPIEIAVVIDRSASMSGPKLQITKEAVTRLIRSLPARDRIAVVAYDSAVRVIGNFDQSRERAAAAVRRLEPGNNTNLYSGWLAGAKLVGPGGRVILLSDGLANEGQFRDAETLGEQASLSYEKYRVTTATIGVGADYDEALMAAMARRGGGAHYFAGTTDAIMEAFSQERFSIGAVVLSHVTLDYAGQTRQLGHLWAGETRRAVLRVSELADPPPTLRFTVADGETRTATLQLPDEFGTSREATLELLVEEAAELEERAVAVRDSGSARKARLALRGLVLRLLAHPDADTDIIRSVRGRLEASMDRLLHLEQRYDSGAAGLHRKRSLQSSHNLREPAKSYSSFEDEQDAVRCMSAVSMSAAGPETQALVVDPRAVLLAPLDRWREWRAVPSRFHRGLLEALLLKPKDGFLIQEIENELGVRVRPLFRRVTEQEILDALDELERAGLYSATQ